MALYSLVQSAFQSLFPITLCTYPILQTHTLNHLLSACSFVCSFAPVYIPSTHYLLIEQPNEWIYKDILSVSNYPMFCLPFKNNHRILFDSLLTMYRLIPDYCCLFICFLKWTCELQNWRDPLVCSGSSGRHGLPPHQTSHWLFDSQAHLISADARVECMSWSESFLFPPRKCVMVKICHK